MSKMTFPTDIAVFEFSHAGEITMAMLWDAFREMRKVQDDEDRAIGEMNGFKASNDVNIGITMNMPNNREQHHDRPQASN